MIKDSGERRVFDSGAVRDIHEGKGRCDLLPVEIISDRLKDRILGFIGEYIRKGDVHSLWFAFDEFITKSNISVITALLEVSKHYEEGAAKYTERNWEKGIPVHCFIDSGLRHYLKFLRGDTDERHDRAFIWNILGSIWTHDNKPELIDLPFMEPVKVIEDGEICINICPCESCYENETDCKLANAYKRLGGVSIA